MEKDELKKGAEEIDEKKGDEGGDELTPEQKAEKEEKELWDEAGKIIEDPDGKATAEIEAKRKTDEEAAEAEAARLKKESDDEAGKKSDTHGSLESVEKALNDTRTYANKIKSEKDALEKRVKELEGKGASQKEVDAAKEALDDLNKDIDTVSADYPELKPVFTKLVESNKKLEKAIEDMGKKVEAKEKVASEEDARADALKEFNSTVKPKIVEKHSDFDTIVKSDQYWKWVGEQRPALKFAASDSADPEDIIWAMTESKKSKYAADIEALEQKDKDTKDKKIKDAQTLRGSSGGFPGPKKGKDPNDPSKQGEYWDEAGKELEKQGVRA